MEDRFGQRCPACNKRVVAALLFIASCLESGKIYFEEVRQDELLLYCLKCQKLIRERKEGDGYISAIQGPPGNGSQDDSERAGVMGVSENKSERSTDTSGNGTAPTLTLAAVEAILANPARQLALLGAIKILYGKTNRTVDKIDVLSVQVHYPSTDSTEGKGRTGTGDDADPLATLPYYPSSASDT